MAGRSHNWAYLKPTKHPTTLDIAWLAGIVEGEGYMTGDGVRSKITVTQKDSWLPNKIQELFGGSIYMSPSQHCHRWQANSERARGIIMTIYKFLSPRRKIQAAIALHKVSPEYFKEA